MPAITVTNLAIDGTDPLTVDQAADAGGDTFVNNGNTLLFINNGGGSPITVTVADSGTATPEGANAFDPDVDIVVTNGEYRLAGPFPTGRFGTTTTVTYSAVTSVTIGALSV